MFCMIHECQYPITFTISSEQQKENPMQEINTNMNDPVQIAFIQSLQDSIPCCKARACRNTVPA